MRLVSQPAHVLVPVPAFRHSSSSSPNILPHCPCYLQCSLSMLLPRLRFASNARTQCSSPRPTVSRPCWAHSTSMWLAPPSSWCRPSRPTRSHVRMMFARGCRPLCRVLHGLPAGRVPHSSLGTVLRRFGIAEAKHIRERWPVELMSSRLMELCRRPLIEPTVIAFWVLCQASPRCSSICRAGSTTR